MWFSLGQCCPCECVDLRIAVYRTREECSFCCYYEHTVGHMNWVRNCCVLSGEKEVLSCSVDRTVRVWDITTRCNTKIMVGHTNWVWDCCEFQSSKGEPRALSASSDLTLRVWDLETGQEITDLRLLGHGDWVLSCRAFSDAGVPKALSSSRDQHLRLWNLETAVRLPDHSLRSALDLHLCLDRAPCAQQTKCECLSLRVCVCVYVCVCVCRRSACRSSKDTKAWSAAARCTMTMVRGRASRALTI